MLNLISEPGVNAHVRAKYQDEIKKVPETLSQGIASSSKELIVKKLEILFMLKELDLVEANLFRLDKKMRTRYKSVVLYWRKHLGYSALSSATEGFDKQTLRRLQETFAEIDEDGSGYLSPEELAALFKKLRMPMSQSKLEDIVDEVDIDGNGLIDFEEFLLVVKNMKNMKSVQSKLGVALAKGANSGVGLAEQDARAEAVARRGDGRARREEVAGRFGGEAGLDAPLRLRRGGQRG